jgi:hypothetical protein
MNTEFKQGCAKRTAANNRMLLFRYSRQQSLSGHCLIFILRVLTSVDVAVRDLLAISPFAVKLKGLLRNVGDYF